MNLLHLSIATPERLVYEADVERVTLTTMAGEITVLAQHIPLISVIKTGSARIVLADGSKKTFALFGGALEVMPDSRMVILTDYAESVEDIDVERAREAGQRAQQRVAEMGGESSTAELQIAQQQLAKHQNRIETVERWKG